MAKELLKNKTGKNITGDQRMGQRVEPKQTPHYKLCSTRRRLRMHTQQLWPNRASPRHSLPQNNKAIEARSVVNQFKVSISSKIKESKSEPRKKMSAGLT